MKFEIIQNSIPPNEPSQKIYSKIPTFYDSSKLYGSESGPKDYYTDFWIYLPILKKPIKPIYQELTPKPDIKKTPIINSQKTVEPTLRPQKTNGNEGISIYGPGNSLIGFMKGKDFIPATGQYTVGMNKSDSDLLNNKIELNKYIQSKFGLYANPIK